MSDPSLGVARVAGVPAGASRAKPGPGPFALAAIFLAWAVLLSAPYWLLGPGSYVRIHDNADGALPMVMAAAAEPGLVPGRIDDLPLTGIDRWANEAGFSPFLPLFEFLPGWLAYGLAMLMQRLVAGYFTYRLLRDDLRLDVLPALWASFFYSLFFQSAVNNSWAGFTLYDGLLLPGLPLVLWLSGRAAHASMPLWLGMSALVGAFIALGGPYSLAPFVLVFVFGWWVWLSRSSPRRRLIDVLWATMLCSAAWLAVKLPALVAAFQGVPSSHRADWDPSSILRLAGGTAWLWSQVGTFALENAPAIAACVIGLLFGLCVRTARSVSRTGDCRGLIAFFVLAVIATFSPLIKQVAAAVGLGGAFQVDRFYLLAPFLWAVAGGIGLGVTLRVLPASRTHATTRESTVRLARAAVAAVAAGLVVCVAVVGVKVTDDWREGARFDRTLGHPAYVWLAEHLETSTGSWRAVTVAASERLHAAYAWAQGVESVDGYLALYPQSYQDYWAAVLNPAFESNPAAKSYFLEWGSRVYLYATPDSLDGEALFEESCDAELLALANVRYVVSPSALESAILREVRGGESDGVWIYENPDALPRAFLVHAARSFPDRDAALDAMSRASMEELTSAAFLVEDDLAGADALPDQNQARTGAGVLTERVGNGRYRIRVDTDAAGILVVTQSYEMNWRVSVDGKPADPFRVDATFLGIRLEPGRHDVEVTAPEQIGR